LEIHKPTIKKCQSIAGTKLFHYMNQFFDPPLEFYDRPDWLSPEEMKDPAKVITDFCENQIVGHIRVFLWNWFRVSLASAEHCKSSASFHGDLILYYQEIETLLEAVWWIEKNAKNKKRN
jgi:hypothetical protein